MDWTDQTPVATSHPFTKLFSKVFFALFYLALTFIFRVAVDLGLMKIKSNLTQKSLYPRERKGEKQQRMIYSKDGDFEK